MRNLTELLDEYFAIASEIISAQRHRLYELGVLSVEDMGHEHCANLWKIGGYEFKIRQALNNLVRSEDD